MPRRAKPMETSFKEGKEDECWLWAGGKSGNYGVCRINGKQLLAHIAVYKKYKGEYPWYLVLDHLCSNTLCVNPNHLEPVSQAVNLKRATTSTPTLNAAKTHCPQGHEYTVENTVLDNGDRKCRICKNACCMRRYREIKQNAL